MNDPTQRDSTRFLENAHRIGRRLTAEGLWEAGRCTWLVRLPTAGAGVGAHGTRSMPAGEALYQGAAGIALFLAELVRCLGGDSECRRAALGGIRYALDRAVDLPRPFLGLHAGRAGVAWAAAQVGTCLEEPKLVDAAWGLLRPCMGHEAEDRALDVISGSAGGILALLALAGGALSHKREALVSSAERMGDSLVARARVEPVGFSWDSPGPNVHHRNLTGYAHGASGFAHALAELYRATGRMKYCYAARQAVLYERHWYDAKRRNWPDFRHVELATYLEWGRVPELRYRLRASQPLPSWTPAFMTAWCHGAAGIGNTRLRLHRILGDIALRQEAVAAVETTARSLSPDYGSHCLCHGSFGNAETLLIAAQVLGDAQRRISVEEFARDACERYEEAGRPWRSGTVGGLPDPSLLMGDAGVGHLLLRLHDPAVPSVLSIASDGVPRAVPQGEEEARSVAEAAVDRFFGVSRQAFRRLGALGNQQQVQYSDEWSPRVALDELSGIITREVDALRRTQLDSACRVERLRYERMRDAHDTIGAYLRLLAREAPDAVNWATCTYRLAPGARVVLGDSGGEPDGAGGGIHNAAYVLFDAPSEVKAVRLGPFAAAVLAAAEADTTVEATCGQVASSMSREIPRAVLRSRVVDQVKEAYGAGIIEVCSIPHALRQGIAEHGHAENREAPTHLSHSPVTNSEGATQ